MTIRTATLISLLALACDVDGPRAEDTFATGFAGVDLMELTTTTTTTSGTTGVAGSTGNPPETPDSSGSIPDETADSAKTNSSETLNSSQTVTPSDDTPDDDDSGDGDGDGDGESESSDGAVDPTACTDERMSLMTACKAIASYRNYRGPCACANVCQFDDCVEECESDVDDAVADCHAKYSLCAEVWRESWWACYGECVDDSYSCTAALQCTGQTDSTVCSDKLAACQRGC